MAVLYVHDKTEAGTVQLPAHPSSLLFERMVKFRVNEWAGSSGSPGERRI